MKVMSLQLSNDQMKALGLTAVKEGRPKAVIIREAIEVYISGKTVSKKEPYEDCLFYRPGKVRGCRFPRWRDEAELYEPDCNSCRYADARVLYGPAEPPDDEKETYDDDS